MPNFWCVEDSDNAATGQARDDYFDDVIQIDNIYGGRLANNA